jgi:hypothetical protein
MQSVHKNGVANCSEGAKCVDVDLSPHTVLTCSWVDGSAVEPIPIGRSIGETGERRGFKWLHLSSAHLPQSGMLPTHDGHPASSLA